MELRFALCAPRPADLSRHMAFVSRLPQIKCVSTGGGGAAGFMGEELYQSSAMVNQILTSCHYAFVNCWVPLEEVKRDPFPRLPAEAFRMMMFVGLF